MRYRVTYSTMNDIYVKPFRTKEEAEKFCKMIRKLYPDQNPSVEDV